MDETQFDHLKAYGIVYKALKNGVKSYWLLNYQGGSFVLEDSKDVELLSRKVGVTIQTISNGQFAGIMTIIENNNMEKVTLEKAPEIAVYTPPGKLPWDDAVTLALTYAEIPYDEIYDKEVVTGKLKNYEWLHLHHEDFTGQYSKFYNSFRFAPWYQRQKMELEKLSKSLGFSKVTECKKAVALAIKNYVGNGGFLFAMCSATNTLDITLASLGTDIVEEPFDGDGIDPLYKSKLDYSQCFAFENFTIQTSADASYFGNIDVNLVNTPMRKDAMDFKLFEFSAKLDPVPTMLTQNHTTSVKGYFGLLTSFNKHVIKKSNIILGFIPGTDRVKYIHGVKGKGQFAFLGGHDPEDYAHLVGDTHTMLELHRNSPGYRLILNNVLFPAAEKKEKKT
ncbi:MAG: asparagine synthetase B [Chitinispirillia bacterium]